MLKHPAAALRDSHGHRWHILDVDGTSAVLRQRGLPKHEQLPEAERRCDTICALGYAGRKRGETQFARAALQHAGTGLWLDAQLRPCRADIAHVLAPMLENARSFLQAHDIVASDCIVGSDGAGGGVPWMHARQKAGMQFLTRTALYELLNDPNVRRHLASQPWCMVGDSQSGPQRRVCELGTVKLRPSAKTYTDYPDLPGFVEARIVVTAIESPDKLGAGVIDSGWRFELVATSIPASAFAAPEVAELYHQRAGLENRFAQEHRELNLNRVFSYCLGGQQFAVTVGLMTWNLRVCSDFNLQPIQPTEGLHPQKERTVARATAPVPDALDAMPTPAEQTLFAAPPYLTTC